MAVQDMGNYLLSESASVSAFLKFLCACVFVSAIGWTIVSAILDAWSQAKQMYQIPCTKCRFFTNDYRLKCTTNPYIANTEAAIDCSDYISD